MGNAQYQMALSCCLPFVHTATPICNSVYVFAQKIISINLKFMSRSIILLGGSTAVKFGFPT